MKYYVRMERSGGVEEQDKARNKERTCAVASWQATRWKEREKGQRKEKRQGEKE